MAGPVDTVVYTTHLLFAALWTGGVVLFVAGVLPSGVSGEIRPEPLAAVTGRLTTLSRASALVLLLTGGHMAGTRYTVGSLTASTPGRCDRRPGRRDRSTGLEPSSRWRCSSSRDC